MKVSILIPFSTLYVEHQCDPHDFVNIGSESSVEAARAGHPSSISECLVSVIIYQLFFWEGYIYLFVFQDSVSLSEALTAL